MIKDYSMSYTIQNHHIITSVSSPYYNFVPQCFKTWVVHDGKDSTQEVLTKQFRRACGLFAGEIIQLARLNRTLTETEKEKFRTSLDALLELHVLLKRK